MYVCVCALPCVTCTTGTIGIVFVIIWPFVVYSTPMDHPRISDEERDFIVNSIADEKHEVICWTLSYGDCVCLCFLLKFIENKNAYTHISYEHTWLLLTHDCVFFTVNLQRQRKPGFNPCIVIRVYPLDIGPTVD